MSYLDWHVGMKVVALRTIQFDRQYHGQNEVLPVKGRVYTIREIGRLHPHYPDHVTIRLSEIRNTPHYRVEIGQVQETFFYAVDFRPIHTRASDISIFTAMLTGSKERARA